MVNGKGSERRPSTVSEDTLAKRWAKVFKRCTRDPDDALDEARECMREWQEENLDDDEY